jgi:hypothetical protein
MSREIVEMLETIRGWGDTGRNMAERIERLLADEREACADRAYEYVQDMGQGLAIASGVREAVLNPSEKK